MSSSRLLTLLVALDLVSKVAALSLVPGERSVNQEALFQFVLNKNESGIGTWGRAAMSYSSEAGTAGGIFAYVSLSLALITVRRWRQSRARKVLVCIAVYLLSATLGAALAPAMEGLPHSAKIFALRGAGVVLALTVWWLVPRGLWKLALTLLTAAALGNFLSLLYPPFRIVDFMYSSVTAFTLRYGVFNVADLYIPVGWACLVIVATRSGLRSFRRSREDPPRPSIAVLG